jgi:hypothetical protein
MNIGIFRRRLLRVHATLLLLAALGSAVATTIGRTTGAWPFGFMRQDPLVWVGLIQAYLLMAIIAVLLAFGSREHNPRRWNVVGALAHVPPLAAALSSLEAFAPLGAATIVWLPISFHLLFLLLEGSAALYPGRASG